MDQNAQYLIIKGAGGGGLGDRIRCVLTALAYAKLSKRKIYVDWSDGRLISQQRNVFFDLFELNNIEHLKQLPQSDSVFPSLWQGRLGESLHRLYTEIDPTGWNRQLAIKTLSFDQSQLDYSAQTLVMWEFDQIEKIRSHYSHGSNIALLKDCARSHLSFSKVILDQAEEFLTQHGLIDENFIAVHIRATEEFFKQKDGVKLDQYVRQIKRYLSCHDQLTRIFVATDNSEVENELRRLFPKQIVSRNKWFASPGEKIHFNDDCPDPEQALIDAVVEMCILAKAEYLIYQYNSSFGLSAHLLSMADEKNISALVPNSGIHQRLKAKLKVLLNSS